MILYREKKFWVMMIFPGMLLEIFLLNGTRMLQEK